jgi:hypothetical protein
LPALDAEAVTGPIQTAPARYAATIGKNPPKTLATLWRLKNRLLRDLPVRVAGFFPLSGGGDPLTIKPTRSKRRKQWLKGWLGCIARLAGTHGRTWSNHRQVLRGMTFALLPDLTSQGTTEKQTNRKQNNENTQIR